MNHIFAPFHPIPQQHSTCVGILHSASMILKLSVCLFSFSICSSIFCFCEITTFYFRCPRKTSYFLRPVTSLSAKLQVFVKSKFLSWLVGLHVLQYMNRNWLAQPAKSILYQSFLLYCSTLCWEYFCGSNQNPLKNPFWRYS